MLIHFGRLNDLPFQELDHLLDIPLAHQVCDQVEHLLINLERHDRIILNNGKYIIDIVLQHLEIVLSQLQDLVQNDHLDIVVIILL